VPPPPPAGALPMPRPLLPGPEAASALTLEQFAGSFEPKPGNYEVTLRNPITGVPTLVRFTLPEGTPRVLLRPREIEFDYGVGRFVRIHFDRGGATVSTR